MNIITHPSTPRNKLIAETLHRLKYVQRTGQGVDIIFREMVSSGKPYPQYHVYSETVTLTIFSAIDDISFVKFIAGAQELTQLPIAEARKSCNDLVKNGLIELSGKEYMLTAKVYEAIKSDVEYTQDKTIPFIKAKNRILDYLERENSITNEEIRELCGSTKQQARAVTDKMRDENILDKVQKKETIAKEDYDSLKKAGLVEGRYPNIFVSYKIATIVGTPAEYVRNKGLDKDIYQQLIVNALKTMKSAKVSDIKVVLDGALPTIMDEKQRIRKVSNILQIMKKAGIVCVEGSGHKAMWVLSGKKESQCDFGLRLN